MIDPPSPGPPAPARDGLPIAVDWRTGYLEVCLTADLDNTVAEGFRERMLELIEDAGSGRMLIDLAHSPFVDSAGLGALVATLKRLRLRWGNDAQMVLLHPSDEVRELFRLTQLDTYLPLFGSSGDAAERHPWIESA